MYPEGDFRTFTEIDCCYTCFEEKVVPLIEESLNVKFRERDAEDYEYEYAEEVHYLEPEQ